MAKTASKTDTRLIGSWQSDGPRTLKELRFHPGLKRRHRQYLRDSFGQLQVRYTRNRIHGVLRDYHFTQPYEVIGSDVKSVAIRVYYDLTEEWLITHIHFQDDRHYWVSSGYIREWFKRVNGRVTKPLPPGASEAKRDKRRG